MASDDSVIGYWGNRTATIDWCENNYEISYYFAEFFNTISNLIMILFPLRAIFWSYRNSEFTNTNTSKQKHELGTRFYLPKSTVLSQFGLLLVGIGSWMFHMTLLYPMQLLDELPMLYCAGLMIYANYDLILANRLYKNQTAHNRVQNKSLLIRIFESKPAIQALLTIYSLVVTVIYCSVYKNPIFHETAYGLMVFAIIASSVAIMFQQNASKPILIMSCIYYATGFFFWNLDNNFCHYLREYRSTIEAMLSLDSHTSSIRSITFNVIVVSLKTFLEFHALWHIFVGFGSYFCILATYEANYRFHLSQKRMENSQKRLVASTCSKLYFYLSNDLLQIKQNTA